MNMARMLAEEAGDEEGTDQEQVSRDLKICNNDAIVSILVPWHYTIEHALLLKVLINTILGPCASQPNLTESSRAEPSRTELS